MDKVENVTKELLTKETRTHTYYEMDTQIQDPSLIRIPKEMPII